jgi:pimeloyl-ACP methyl ester carboxylesterase
MSISAGTPEPKHAPSRPTETRSSRNRNLTILMLHGRGVTGPGENWPGLVEQALASVAFAPVGASTHRLREARILAPSYAFWTQGSTEPLETLEKVITFPVASTVHRLRAQRSGTARRPRTNGKRVFGDISALWGSTGMKNQPSWDAKVQAEFATALMPDFQAYLNDRETNDGVRYWVLSEIPSDGDLIIVGHSMGSLVALDVLHDLPESIRVLGLITIGSPLAYPGFHGLLADHHLERAAARAPFWVNILDPSDRVTGSAAVSTSWSVASHALDVPVSNGELGAGMLDKHSAKWYLQQPAFGVALDRMIFGAPRQTEWDPVEELDWIRHCFKGSGHDDVSFRSRIRAIRVAQKVRRGEASRVRDPAFAATPKAGVTLEGVIGSLSWLAASMWSPTGKYNRQTRRALNLTIGDLPFQQVVDMVLKAADRAGAALGTAFPGYHGLPPESSWWDQIGPSTYVTGSGFNSGTVWMSGPFQSSDPHDMTFLSMRLMMQASVHLELVGPPAPNLHGTLRRIRNDLQKSQAGTTEHDLGVVVLHEFERMHKMK